MDSISIVRPKVKTLNRSIYKKTFEVKVFSKSEELSYLKRLVDKNRFNDALVFDKLCFRFKDRPSKGGYYLKNKYLYLTTKGLISYLGAREQEQTSKVEQYIIRFIQGWLDEDTKSKINIISLGAGDSIKESKIFAQFKVASLRRINYIPVDVSPMLIQLGINNFAANNTLKNLNVSSIVSDIWDLAASIDDAKEEVAKSKMRKDYFGEGKRLFLLLGSTFGSYPESDFLKQIVDHLMDDENTLLIGFQKVGDKFCEESLYSDPGFLLAPLTYIPYFYGYSQYPGSFLKTTEFLHNGDISDIPNSKSLARYINLENGRQAKDKRKIYLTWDTHYVPEDLVDWLSKFPIEKHKLTASLENECPNIVKVIKDKSDIANTPYEANYENSYSINHSVYYKSFDVKVFSKSEELSFLQGIKKERDYLDQQVFYKLFCQYEIKDVRSDYYLKNKYLYVTTNGIIDYLRLYEAQQISLSDFFDFEKNELKDIIYDLLEQIERDKKQGALSIVSLGAAISDKEMTVFEDVLNENKRYQDKIKYYPVDISPMLIQLGINTFSSKKTFEKFDVKSIVADFWSLADYIREVEKEAKARRASFFGKGKRLFNVLGGTFGNYSEKEFLDQIVELMDEGDELMISVKLQQENRPYSPDLDYRNLPGNEGFLLEPLTFIPMYSGYSKYYRNYLITDSRSNLSEGDEELRFISVIPKSQSTVPYIETDRFDGGLGKSKIRLAWSTRYDSTSLKEWFSDTYKLGNPGEEVYKLEFCKDSKGNDWYHREQKRNNYSVMRLRKARVQYGTEIQKVLSDYSLDRDADCMAAFTFLEEKKLLDKAFYDSILDAAKQFSKRNSIKKCLLNKQKAD